MRHPREGQRVSYIGITASGLLLGDQGKVVSADDSGSHVKWATGSRLGAITFEDNEDLAPSGGTKTAVADELNDSLEYGSMSTVAARQVYDTEGASGLLTALEEAGHLASLAEAAEEAVSSVARHVRTATAFRPILAQLEPEESESLVMLTANSLLRDAVGSE